MPRRSTILACLAYGVLFAIVLGVIGALTFPALPLETLREEAVGVIVGAISGVGAGFLLGAWLGVKRSRR